jgi:protein-S-isoprenylcysteine O-methyltransferase Ste14
MPWGKFYSYLLVFLQFIFICFIIIYSSFRDLGFVQLTLIILGAALGLWAVVTMRKSKIRATPDIARGARLIKIGPYKYIRHPMYASILTICLGFFLTNIYSMTILFYVLLINILTIKIFYEERLLGNAFPGYKSYTKKTKKMIPFVY